MLTSPVRQATEQLDMLVLAGAKPTAQPLARSLSRPGRRSRSLPFPAAANSASPTAATQISTCVWFRGANGLSLQIPEPRRVVFADKGTALFAQLAAGRKATNCYPAGERSTWKASPQGHHPASECGRANVEPMIRFHSTPGRQAVTAGVPLLVAAKNLDQARARRSGTIGQLGALLHRGRHPWRIGFKPVYDVTALRG